MIESRFRSMYSNVWGPELVKAIRRYPRCAESKDPISDMCEACNRKRRHASAQITFSGEAYCPDSYLPASESEEESGEESDPEPEVVKSEPSSRRRYSGPAFSISAGRTCALRVTRYHHLYHFIYYQTHRVRERLAETAFAIGIGGSDREAVRSDPAWPASLNLDPALVTAMLDRWLGEESDGDAWVSRQLFRLQAALDDADDVLSNKVGALERTV
ncbi:hypothetical protein BC828DRAFT_394121 [Blastocladiella britannica]|nr:hypothetical protein BC828DRAFT_394121 [Blastocladiella britannica]